MSGDAGLRARRAPAQRAVAGWLDRQARRLLRGGGLLELALGETLLQLLEGHRLLRITASKPSDYVRERLGASWRSAQEWLQLARGLEERPVLRRAVIAGAVSPSRARAILPVAVGEAESAWVERAMRTPETDLRAMVRRLGHELPDEPARFASRILALDPAQRERLDAGLCLAEEVLGEGRTRWCHLEVLAQEYLGEFGAILPERAPVGPGEKPEHSIEPTEARRLAALVLHQLEALEEAGALLAVPPEAGVEPVPADALSLHRRALRLKRALDRRDLALGVVLCAVVDRRAWKTLGFDSLTAYVEQRLGMPERTFRERVWMERRMRTLPPLRVALESGRLNQAQARIVARRATPADVEERISLVATTSVEQARRQDDAEEQRQNRARGIERLWGPEEVLGVVGDALECARLVAEASGETISEGEALARVADHFTEVWRGHCYRRSRRKPTARERRRAAVLRRTGGRCAVPGCTNRAVHLHHLTFRSRGGSDDEHNLVGLCAAHHLHAVHEGRLRVRGRAGVCLRWEFGEIDEEGRQEVWFTRGDDDVRRAEHVMERAATPSTWAA